MTTRRIDLECRNLSKWFDVHGEPMVAVSDVSMQVWQGDFVSIVGPSGCGKSTLLNIVAGVTEASEGTVSIRGRSASEGAANIGYVTQRDDLLPWRTVQGNIELPLELKHWTKAARRRTVEEWVHRTGLTGFESHYPSQLSGGMRKRVALARTLAYGPDLLLMDEPFSALDAQMRLILQEQLLELCAGSDITVLFVTHDLLEAIVLSDHVVVMSSRPARIKDSFPVPLLRPRDILHMRFDDESKALHDAIWKLLVPEISDVG